MVLIVAVATLILGFIVGVRFGENRFADEISNLVDLMRLDGVIRW